MNPLNPQPPFVWPEPRVLEEICTYEHQPPFGDMVLNARFLFGIVSAPATRGIDVLKTWMDINKNLKVSLIVMVYPACATKQRDIYRLRDLFSSASPRLFVHVHPLEWVTDRASNALYCLAPDQDVVHILTGPSEDFGLSPMNDGHINFVFRGDPVLVEGFKRWR